MRSQEHPHLHGEPAPAIPPPEDSAGDPLESEGLEQAHRRIVVPGYGGKHPVGPARSEEPERFLDERPSGAHPARLWIDRDEVHVPDGRRPAEENPLEEAHD